MYSKHKNAYYLWGWDYRQHAQLKSLDNFKISHVNLLVTEQKIDQGLGGAQQWTFRL